MTDEQNIILATDAGIFIDSFQTIYDAVGKCYGAEGLILTEDNVSPEFFNLRTGLAGELFQKLTNYHVKLALVLQNTAAYGERFSELVLEHRTHNMIRFFKSVAEAKTWLNTNL
jgi:Domain of unknown function (DUF4180)